MVIFQKNVPALFYQNGYFSQEYSKNSKSLLKRSLKMVSFETIIWLSGNMMQC